MNAKRILLLVLLMTLGSLAVSAQCSDADKKALEKFDRDWAKHGDARNRAELEKIYADDFVNIGLMEMTGKKEAIDNTMNDTNANPPEVWYDNYMITCTPSTATVTHRNVAKTPSGNVNYSRSIHVLEKRNGRWQVVSSTGHPMNGGNLRVMNKEMDGYQAYMRRDVAWFEKNVADNYMGMAPDGKQYNKAQMIEGMKADKSKYEMMKLSDVSVRQEGDMAVITGIYHFKGMDGDGKPMDMKMRFTRTLMREDGGDWQLIASQSTILNDAP